MSETNGSTTLPEGVTSTTTQNEDSVSKGKGKAVDPTPVHDATMEEDDDSEEEEEDQARGLYPEAQTTTHERNNFRSHNAD